MKFHFGNFVTSRFLGKVDSWRNILSNKVAAAFRMEIKDFVDIWVISKNRSFNWMEIFNESKQKDPGVDPIALANLFISFPINKIDAIKWIKKPNVENLKKEFIKIANDILFGKDNLLFK